MTDRPTVASRRAFARALADLAGLTGLPQPSAPVRFRAQATALDTAYRAGEAAAAALAAGARIAASLSGRAPDAGEDNADIAVEVSSRHAEASLISFALLRFADPARGIGPRIAGEQKTAVAGFHRTGDGDWVYLHAGFPHNTEGLLKLLGVPDEPDAVRRALSGWTAQGLEDAVAEAGLCGARVRTSTEWDASPQGRLLAATPIVEVIRIGDSPPEPVSGPADRPLAGTRVLDLTRVLAGPTCARTLAAYGADALRVGAEHLPTVPLFVVDTGFGKRFCHLDLRSEPDRARLRELVRQADVFSQGYRSGALERLGFSVPEVAGLRPGIVYVSINCYGHEGAWRPRPGWEQLAQTVTGMAHEQGLHLGVAEPTLLPAAVNDYITGYLAAYGALTALARRAVEGGSYWVRVSLARTAMWVRSLGTRDQVRAKPLADAEIEGISAAMDTHWGEVSYLKPAMSAPGLKVGWSRPPSPPGADPAALVTG